MVLLQVAGVFGLQRETRALHRTQDQIVRGRVEGTRQRCELATIGLDLARRGHADTRTLVSIVRRCDELLAMYKEQAK